MIVLIIITVILPYLKRIVNIYLVSALQCCHRNVSQELFVSKLNNIVIDLYYFTDADLFGLCPAWDEFYLVRCNECHKVLKPMALKHHIGKFKAFNLVIPSLGHFIIDDVVLVVRFDFKKVKGLEYR